METKVLDLAFEAGHILLENGAEISRVEDVMRRIAKHYGVNDGSYFILSNGIFTTGENYSRTQYIPLKGTNLKKIIEVNQLSRDLPKYDYSIDELKDKLDSIKNSQDDSILSKLVAAAFGCAGFCAIFGGSINDCLASLISGFLLNILVIFACPHFTKPLGNIISGALGTALCILFNQFGLGDNLGNMIVGTMILLIPGVAFTNGLRDIANEDYISGTTRLMDALMVFFCIAIGVCVTFYLHGFATGGIIKLQGTITDSFTSNFFFQLFAAFIGTSFFAVIFGVPSKYCAYTGIVGMAGWMIYLATARYTPFGTVAATFLTATAVASLSRYFARWFKCPGTVFLICGIFPLIPGGGVFWSSYYLVSKQYTQALSSGFSAIILTVAIVVGIILSFNIFHRR